ncbi:MAG TPA: hypothetical protein VJA27_04065 [Patescibacteria group bacterium]|nr:hypothetical protein [Patescibacteria group bacterium]
MKSAQRQKIAQVICESVENLVPKGKLLVQIPRGRILRGVYFENSQTPDSCYVWIFVQPLYVPSPHVVFNIGERLGGGSKIWKVEEAGAVASLVKKEGVAFFGSISSPETLARWQYLEERTDPYALQARAYSLVASGYAQEGVDALHALTDSLTSDIPWVLEMKSRAEQLAQLAESNLESAQESLSQWEKETAIALGVDDLR